MCFKTAFLGEFFARFSFENIEGFFSSYSKSLLKRLKDPSFADVKHRSKEETYSWLNIIEADSLQAVIKRRSDEVRRKAVTKKASNKVEIKEGSR